WRHDVCNPASQKMQVPSENANGITTTSPRFSVRTPLPTSSTTPIASCPITRAPSLGCSVLYGQRSDPQIHARVTRSSASVGSRIVGSGTSSIRTSPAAYITVPRIPRPPSAELERAPQVRALADLLLDRLLGELARVDAESLLQHLRVLFVVDLVRQFLQCFLDVFVFALLAQQIDDLLFVQLHRDLRSRELPRHTSTLAALISSVTTRGRG